MSAWNVCTETIKVEAIPQAKRINQGTGFMEVMFATSARFPSAAHASATQ